MRVVAVAAWKGGCGKTTTALSLAGALARRNPEQTVYVADFDAQGNSTLSLVRSAPAAGTGALLEGAAVASVRAATAVSNLWLLAADDVLDRVSLDPPRVAYRLRLALARTEGILVADTAPGVRAVTRGVMAVADAVIVPVPPEPFSAAGLHRMATEMASGAGAMRMVVMRTMWSPRLREAISFEEHLAARYPEQLLETAIPRDAEVQHAVHDRLPVTVARPRSRGGRAYAEACEEVCRRWHLDAPR